MKLGEFINLRNKMKAMKEKAKEKTIHEDDMYKKKIEIDGKSLEYIYEYGHDELGKEFKKYNLYSAINSMTNILGDITPVEYMIVEEYFSLFKTYEDDRYLDKLDQKLESLNKYLGEDYEIPNEIYEYIDKINEENIPMTTNKEQFRYVITNRTIQYCFWLWDATTINGLIKRVATQNIELCRNMDNDKKENNSKMILARIMSDEELNEFEQKGIVTEFSYRGHRIWEERNSRGKRNYYTFMALNNRKNTLLNASSVIPYFETRNEESDADINLVFFETDIVNEEMIYSGPYLGRIVIDEYDDPGVYGADSSEEIAIPYYSNKHFKILKSCKTNVKKLREDFYKCTVELDILNNDDMKKSESIIYRDFLKMLHNDGHEIDDVSEETLLSEFTGYYADLDYNEYFRKTLGIEDIGEDLHCCMKKLQSRYKFNDYDMYEYEGKILQNILNWSFVFPDEFLGVDIDAEYDFGEDEDDYDENNYDGYKPITEDEIESTIKENWQLDREEAEQLLTELVQEKNLLGEELEEEVK